MYFLFYFFVVGVFVFKKHAVLPSSYCLIQKFSLFLGVFLTKSNLRTLTNLTLLCYHLLINDILSLKAVSTFTPPLYIMRLLYSSSISLIQFML